MTAQNKVYVPVKKGGNCCCGQFEELFYSNLDFEEAPLPPPGDLITYSAGQFFSGWTCTRATIDHKDAFFGNLTVGNPNGRSNFIDLHGSPGFGAIEYNLTGLTPGNLYRIDFWTAQNGSGYTSTGTLKIAGGAWLTANWTVDTDGSIYWFKVSNQFMAMATTAKMEFSSVGGSEWGGTLIDDITIYECPGDVEFPVVNNPPDDVEIECDFEIPKSPDLVVSDNCDLAPEITFKESIQILSPCSKILTRNWEIKDDCGNKTTVAQLIKIEDKSAPEFTKLPEDKWIPCSSDIKKEFNDWIKKNGNSSATDRCGKISWRNSIDHDPKASCDTIIVEFIAIDHCGQENSAFAKFYIVDTVAPEIIKEAENKTFYCNNNARDSLRNWLKNQGNAIAKEECDTIIWSNNFKGDSSLNIINVEFYAKDRCGNVDTTKGTFSNRNGSDTFRISQTSCSIIATTLDTFRFTINGCDSIVIVQTMKVNSDTTILTVNTCDPLQIPFDTSYFLNSYGCDSLLIRQFDLHPSDTSYLLEYSCNILNKSYDTLKLQGYYCDSFVITEHIPLRKDSIFINNKTCDSLQSGTTLLNLKNTFNCDSVVVINTTYSNQTITKLISKECGLQKFFQDTITFKTLLCDSLVITDHIPLPADRIFWIGHTCDPKQSGKFITVLKNQFGCDSIVDSEIIADPVDSIYSIQETCDPGQVRIQKTIFKNIFGCDSILVSDIRLKPGDSILIRQTTCRKNEAGIFKTSYKNRYGCDSIVVLQKDFIKPDTTIIKEKTCKWNEQRHDTTLFSTPLCDSVVIHHIQFILSDSTYIQSATCHPMQAGKDTIYLKNQQSCDSVIFRNFIYTPLKLMYGIDSIQCFNQNDGRFIINNTSDFTLPFQLILNNKSLGFVSSLDQLGPGIYRIFIIDNAGCTTDSVEFSLMNPPALVTELGSNLAITKGASIQLNLQSNKSLKQIIWLPNNLTNCSNCKQISIHPESDLWVYCISTDERNCTSLDSVYIKVNSKTFVYAPNVISPNGDQINDYFYLITDENAVVELLQIFDRWGELLFSKEQFQANRPEFGWDGTFKNVKMNPGVYVYFAKIKLLDGSTTQVKGDFSLLR